MTFWASAYAADIYQSTDANGAVRYATQALDPSFTLIFKDTPARAAGKQVRPATQPALDLEPLIQEMAQRHTVDAALIRAVIDVESRFNPAAVSSKGAVGPMQLMPATASRYGVTDRTDIAQNLDAGVRYLKDLLLQHHGNVALALASYNAGEGTVARYGRRIPPYKETMLYVPAVLSSMQAAQNALPQ
ncbi:lytic transglycosylase domain-containing protein [Collimonas sp. NPDC087041]|uniref:lytic transglycosylase domain-containing protein n=1 Tax=Collimonas sp. NPDC087041 TaxID=3363960 RepID=UPI003804D285